MQWHIGCSGYHYRDWKEVFYPPGMPQRSWFEYYSSRFDTLELNTTFYRFPQLTTLEKWYETSPAHFVFSAKAPRLITHYKRFNDCQSLLSDFYSAMEKGLKEKLAVVLFQFPPTMAYSREQLKKLLDGLSGSFTNVVEFRHASWWTEEVYARLSRKRIVFSGISHPALPQTTIINRSTVYYRFHGIPRIFYSRYTEGQLKSFCDGLLEQANTRQVFVYFNNTASTAAIRNAVWLKKYIGQAEKTG